MRTARFSKPTESAARDPILGSKLNADGTRRPGHDHFMNQFKAAIGSGAVGKWPSAAIKSGSVKRTSDLPVGGQ
jgi:hypothetical protein